MATPNYQYEPLTPPSSWNAEERRFVQRIADIFDDIYLKYGRMGFKYFSNSVVERINAISDTADGAQAAVDNVASLILTPEQIKATVTQSDEYTALSNSVTLNSNELAIVQTETTELEGRVQTIEESVVIDGSTITIGKSDVPVQNIINETGFSIKEVGGSELAYVREGKMGAQRLLLEDELIIGGAALKDMQDGHVLLLKYGG